MKCIHYIPFQCGEGSVGGEGGEGEVGESFHVFHIRALMRTDARISDIICPAKTLATTVVNVHEIRSGLRNYLLDYPVDTAVS